MFHHAWGMQGWISAVGAMVGTYVERSHELPSASHSCVQPPLKPVWVAIMHQSCSQAEDATAPWLRHISGRPAAIARIRHAGDTLRETDGGKDSCGHVELEMHSWKEELHVKRGHPVAHERPTLGRDIPVELWMTNAGAGTTLRDCDHQINQ